MKRRKLAKVWGTTPRHARIEYQIRMGHWFAGLKGFSKSSRGGWIYGPSGKPVAQGWVTFYEKYRAAIVELVWGAEATPRNTAVADPFRGILNQFSGGVR